MKFIFIYSDGKTTDEVNKRAGAVMPEFARVDTGSDDCLLLANETDSRFFLQEPDLIGVIQGYVRYPDLAAAEDAQAHNRKLFRETLDEKFPLDEDVANSFASFAFDSRKKQVAIANDLLGFYPIYYCVANSRLIITSHLLLISRILDCEIDHTGVIQRLTGSEFCNFGARTILKDVFRLLPGECIKYDLRDNFGKSTRYDNSLYSGDFNTNLKESAKSVWHSIKEESELCFKYDKDLAIGMSGGMDSRILLASLPVEKSITCYTYGHEAYYETKIARRCAQSLGIAFQSFPEDEMLFPDKYRLQKYVLETEAVGINQWLSVLENLTPGQSGKIPMALGEMTESIAARNIKSYSSRNARIKVFLGLKKIEFTSLNEEKFSDWKLKTTSFILDRISGENLPFEFDHKKVMAETRDDLEALFKRIETHDIKYVELLDELFNWYVHARMPMSNQLLLLRAKFHPVCPTMSAKFLRDVSRIHPSLRLNSNLMDELFRLPDLRTLSLIPTAQIPFINYNNNNKIKLLAWGIRSKIDQAMIKLAARRKKVRARNRLLKSTNWALQYSKADPEIVHSWFSPDFVGHERFIKTFSDRASQKAHPLTPFDIVSAAGVNIEIEFIESNGKSLSRNT